MGPDGIRNKDFDGEVSSNLPDLTNQHTLTDGKVIFKLSFIFLKRK